MIFVLHIVVLCRFTLRSYAANVLPASYAWSTFTGPVSGEVQEIKPPSSSYGDDERSSYASDYVAKPHYSFAYGVENPNTGESHGHSETRDGATVTGEYSVMEPDGVLRRVQYTADPKNGFRASVRYVRPDGEETPSRDHGYQSGQNRVPPGSQSQSLSSEYGSDGGDESTFNVAPPQTSEYESDGGDQPFGAIPSSGPLHFGFDKYNDNDNNNNIINDINDDGGGGSDYHDDGGGGGLSAFKFPSSPASPFFKGSAATANAADLDDYGDNDNKYRPWGAFGSHPTSFDDDSSDSFSGGPASSPAPFGLPSSLSPSFGVAPPSPSSSQLYVAFPRLPSQSEPPPPCRPLATGSLRHTSRPPLSANVANYRTNRFRKRPSDGRDDDDNDPDRFRSTQVDIDAADGGDDDNEDIENELDDSDTDNALHVTDVQLSPSNNSQQPQPLSTPPPPASSPRSPSFAATPEARSPSFAVTPSSFHRPTPPSLFHRPSSQPTTAGPSSPSSVVTPDEPTVDISD